ncbi:MAG: PAS domain-containing protein [Synergistales bacterium]|nr:PAS domain-containing protein [Synergistales bacterium]
MLGKIERIHVFGSHGGWLDETVDAIRRYAEDASVSSSVIEDIHGNEAFPCGERGDVIIFDASLVRGPGERRQLAGSKCPVVALFRDGASPPMQGEGALHFFPEAHLPAIPYFLAALLSAQPSRSGFDEVSCKEELAFRDRQTRFFIEFAELVQQPGIDVPGLLRGTVNRLPSVLQYSDRAWASIEYPLGTFYKRGKPESRGPSIGMPLVVDGKREGRVSVGYGSAAPQVEGAAEECFRERERRVVAAATERLGRVLERLRASEDLESERTLRGKVMELVPVPMTVVDRHGRIVFANARAEELFGLARADITRRTYDDDRWQIADPEGGAFEDESLPFVQVRKAGEPLYGIYHSITRSDGRQLLLSISAAPLYDERGEFDGMVSVLEPQTATGVGTFGELDQERGAVDSMYGGGTQNTARSYGQEPMKRRSPTTFRELVATYRELLDNHFKGRVKNAETPQDERTRELAFRLGGLRAGPKDVTDLHTSALAEVQQQDLSPAKRMAYMAESRLVALELMGYLVLFYRRHSVSLPGRDSQGRGQEHG